MTKLLIGLLLTLTLAACAEQANEPYKFGAVLPLTGTNAFYGTFSKAGITLAVEDINANGGINNRPVEVVYEDSGGDKTKATTAAQKLINVDGVDALMTTTTPMSGAVAPVAEENKIPLIYFSATNAFAINKTYVFKDFPDATLQCEKLAQQVKQDGHAAVALFGTDAEFTHFCKQGVEKVMSVTTFEIYPPGETDYRAQLAKIQNGHNTALILSAFSSDCAHALRQLRESGIKATLYSPYQSYTCGSPENSKIYPDLLEGAYGIDVPLNEKTPEFAAFKQRIEQRGGTTLIGGSAVQYDITLTLAKAFNGCSDNICVANNIRNTNFVGISGRVSYGGGQIVERGTMLTRFENGNWVRAE